MSSNEIIYKLVIELFFYPSSLSHQTNFSFKFILLYFDARYWHTTDAWEKYTDILLKPGAEYGKFSSQQGRISEAVGRDGVGMQNVQGCHLVGNINLHNINTVHYYPVYY